MRALRRVAANDLGSVAEEALSGIAELPLNDGVIMRARRVGTIDLRSRYAFHLASAGSSVLTRC